MSFTYNLQCIDSTYGLQNNKFLLISAIYGNISSGPLNLLFKKKKAQEKINNLRNQID